MDFVKKNWQFRDIISENELNRMEDGIEEGITKAEQAQQTADEANQKAEQAQQTAESHASRHASGGPDPITPAMIGAETPSGAQAKVNAHASRTDNPHNVTKAQVGLGNVQNYGIATQAQAEAGTANNVYMTPLRVAQAIAALSPGGIKSVQRGSGTIPFEGQTVDVTISTVNRNKAFVIAYSRGSTDGFYHAITAQLTSNTNLRITRGLNYGDTTPFTWEVVEFN